MLPESVITLSHSATRGLLQTKADCRAPREPSRNFGVQKNFHTLCWWVAEEPTLSTSMMAGAPYGVAGLTSAWKSLLAISLLIVPSGVDEHEGKNATVISSDDSPAAEVIGSG